MRRIYCLITLLICVCFASQAQNKLTYEEYILKFKDLVLESQEKYGIPASVKMAQGLLESGAGNSRLATQAHNHFGIKCKSSWTGQKIYHDDDEKGECFRKYDSDEESFIDHSEFLDGQPRYQSLFALSPTDYKGWAYGLKAAGYATNPKYPEILIGLIEKYELYTLDTEQVVAQKVEQPNKQRDEKLFAEATSSSSEKIDADNYMVSLRLFRGYSVYTNNGSEFVVANGDETYESLAKTLRISARKLYKYNDVKKGAELNKGDKVYIKMKSKRADNGKMIHLVQDGDTMWSISQHYGIRLKNLASFNGRDENALLSKGQQIRLM